VANEPAGVERLAGNYYSDAVGTIQVAPMAESLALVLPGLPSGFEIRLEARSEVEWVVTSSMLAGMPGLFTGPAGQPPVTMRLGNFDYQRQQAGDAPVIGMRRLPDSLPNTTRDHRFERLYQQALADGPSLPLVYNLPYPKYEFLQYIKRTHGPVFHGSNNTGIQVFEPVRKSFELFDDTGRGNLGAVYATHYPLWAMFFAVINGLHGAGSISNGVFQLTNPAGEAIDLYFFAASSEILDAGPWVDGMLYILPPATFRQLSLPNGALSNEWASETPVVPLAKMPVSPDDFPFKGYVGRFDDPQLKRMSELTTRMFALAEKADFEAGALTLTLRWEADLPEFLGKLVEMQQIVLPQLTTTISPLNAGNPVTITMHGPDAVIQVYSERARKQGLLPDQTTPP
jgi:hypothetical protein